ncbi:MAG: hypothetical protein RQ856_00130 [Candidatus Izemoplasmatales bacterium]|nr:hypothetical protein [Candidatus Izemoplasmatales bacterium]
MKKLLVLLLALVFSFGLVACSSEPLANAEKDYYATGNFNGWDTVEAGKMVAIAKNDDRVASIKGELSGVEFLYLLEATLPATEAGWTATYTIDGTETTVDGNLTVKVIRTTAGDPDARDWWAQSPESGEIVNLTPETLYIPPFVEENVDGAGGWNDNPIAFEAGTYYIVFAEFEDGVRALALIPVVA